MLRFRNDEKQAQAGTVTNPTFSPTPAVLSVPPTTEEVARAVTALEQRRAEERAHTIQQKALRSTLEEMDSEVTESDVLAEVARQREAARQEQETAQKHRKQRTRKALLATLCCIPALALGFAAYSFIEESAQQAARKQEERRVQIEQTKPFSWKLPDNTLVISHTPTGTRLRTLAEVPDGEMVEVMFQDFYPGERLSASDVTERLKYGNTWHVVKYNGHPYIRGYIPTSMSTAALQQGNIWLTNYARPGIRVSQSPFNAEQRTFGPDEPIFTADKPTQVTLPLEGIRINRGRLSGGSIGNEGFNYESLANNIQTDSHLWESWPDSHGTKTAPRP